MSAFTPLHIERSHAFVVEQPLERAFRLFEPEGERLWAKGWNPEYLHPAGANAALRGMVFRTGHGGEETLWTVVRHEPATGLVEYVRATPGSRLGTVLVQCARLDVARTRVTVVYSLTALSEKGNEILRALDAPAYEAFIGSWEKAITEKLAAG